MKSLNCKICKKEYLIQDYRADSSKYCSYTCLHKSRRGIPSWNKGKKGTQSANSGSFKKGEHRNQATEFNGDYAKDKHWNWKGGITSEQDAIRTSAQYKFWRTSVFNRDNYTCLWCGKRNGNGKTTILHADHIKPFAYFPELRFELTNGRTLCKECHKTTDTFAGKSFRRFI